MNEAEKTARILAIKEKDLEITEQCKAEIQIILEKYDCYLEVGILVKSGGNEQQVIIRRND